MAQKLATLYHLLLQREQLLTSDLHTPTTLITLHRSTPVREAQADIVEAGVGRRADLGQVTLSSQISPTPGWTLPYFVRVLESVTLDLESLTPDREI